MIKKPIYTLMLIGLMILVGQGNVFAAKNDISESKKIKLNLLKDPVVSESRYENLLDYGTQVNYLEIVEINESNIKERIPVVIKRAMPQVTVDKVRKRIVLNYPLGNRRGKEVDLFNKGEHGPLLVRYVTKFNDGRFPVNADWVTVFQEIPAKIVNYKECVQPDRYFGVSNIDDFRAFSVLEVVLMGIADNGEAQIKIVSDKSEDKNIKIETNRAKVIEFPRRKIDLSEYGDLKKIELRHDYKLPKKMVAETKVYITNYGVYSIFGESVKPLE